MQLCATPSAKFFVQHEYNEVSIEADKLILASDFSEEHIPFSIWSGKITIERGVVWGKLMFHAHIHEGKEMCWLVQGLPWESCRRFVRHAQKCYQTWHHTQCERLNSLLPQWHEALVRLQNQPAFLATSQVSDWGHRVSSGLDELNISVYEAEQMMPKQMEDIVRWLAQPKELQQTRNQVWLESERQYWQVLFEQCESSPLNLAQQQAVLMNNDHNLILAGAGSGKTSVLSARVSYLLQSHQALPEQILLVAFGRNAASEMKQRLDTKLGSAAAQVSVKTFHSLGLDIIKHVEKEPVSISPLTTNDKAKQAWCIEWLKYHWTANNNFKRWQKHLSQWPIAYLTGDEELGSQSENPKLIAWLEKQLEQLSACQLNKKQLQQRIVENEEYPRLNSELQLTWPCYQAWQQMLKEQNQIDFHTMISRATKYIESGKYKPEWQFVMVDEYQDISPSRLALLEALCLQPKSDERASLYAVGDDWQAIYRFAGADVQLTTDFSQRFTGASVHYLDTTYRFNSRIGDVANTFIMQNDNQLHKELNSAKVIKQKSVYICPMTILEESLIKLNDKATTRKDVLLLGRNHYHCPSTMDEWKQRFSNLSLQFMTCHASKGQEADFVFILNVDEGQFPCVERQLHLDGALLQSQDDFPNAEERRLFYVALTRAKEKAWVLYGAHPSGFVEELRTGDYPVIKNNRLGSNMNIGIYIYEYAEPIDFSGPYEVFASANRYASEYGIQFTPYLISEGGSAVSARHGFQVLPHRSFENHPELDALIVVGGAHKHEMNNSEGIEWIQEQAKRVKFIASVGTGAFLLAKANLLQGRRVTTHWQDIEQLSQEYPSLSVVKNVRWVEDGEVMTSSGMSAGIDMSLQIVARLSKQSLAKKTAHQIGFDWREEHVVAY